MIHIELIVEDRVRDALVDSARESRETAGVLIVGRSDTPGTVRLLGRRYVPAPPESYRRRTRRSLVLSPAAYMPALAQAASLGANALFVHTHPVGSPAPSNRDAVVDDLLRPVFQIRLGGTLYGSLVVKLTPEGQIEFTGRIWEDEDFVGPIARMSEVGTRLRIHTAYGHTGLATHDGTFDRQVLAFGPPMQRLLGSLRVGVVGLGGTGSAVTEQLTRLGVGALTLVDDDVITSTNVTRVYGSHLENTGATKVTVAAANVAGIGLGTVVTAIEGRSTAPAVLDALRECDVVFGCTDDNAGRVNLSRLTVWCLIPVIDLGVRIISEGGTISGIWGRVNIQLPGRPCLVCWNVVDQERLRIEQLGPSELDALEAEGYVQGFVGRDPAVIAYTSLVASLGVSELLLRLAGIGAAPDQVWIQPDGRQMRTATRPLNVRHWCGDAANLGRGTLEPFLGRTAWA